MCALLTTEPIDIWLLGPSVQQAVTEQFQGMVTNCQQPESANFFNVCDWATFRQEILVRQPIGQKRIALLCDISALSYEDIFGIINLREKHAFFIPVIFYDQPHLGKFIHTFDADFSCYCTATDAGHELLTMLHSIKTGKSYYSTGFCTLLDEYGFISNENS